MAFSEDSNNMVMPVAPMYGGGNGFGNGFGDGSFWILLLFILLGGNAWGGGFGGGFDNNLYPWMNQSDQISNGFRDQMLNSSINNIQSSITSGFGDVQNALCGGFAGVNAAITGTQMADMERSFALQSQLAQCCCDNRAATADLKYTVATEACADRAAVSEALRDVLTANTASTQRILDQMCQDKIDAKNEKIAELQNRLTMAELAATQNAQTAAILTDNLAQTNALEQYLAPVPRPAYVVQNPNCCTNSCSGCGF